MPNMIECRIVVNDIIPLREPWSFSKWAGGVHKRLREVGIPANIDGSVDSGRLFRLNDPADFGVTCYHWYPGELEEVTVMEVFDELRSKSHIGLDAL